MKFLILHVLNGGSKTMYPKDCIPFLKDKCSNLTGPHCVCDNCRKPKTRKKGIVEAGMAGLTLAWIMQYIGHEVIIWLMRFKDFIQISGHNLRGYRSSWWSGFYLLW